MVDHYDDLMGLGLISPIMLKLFEDKFWPRALFTPERLRSSWACWTRLPGDLAVEPRGLGP